MSKINGTRVTRSGISIFIPLPVEMQTPIKGGCECSFCKEHPEKVPMWDTLAVYANAPDWIKDDTAVTIHYPELQEKK